MFQLHVQLIREMTKQAEEVRHQLGDSKRKNQQYKHELDQLRRENLQLK